MLTRARIDESIGHGARDLRGRVATALSFDPERRFTGGNMSGPMNLDAESRVQIQQLKGMDQMKFTGAVCLVVSLVASLGAAGAVAAADPFYIGSWTFTAAVVAPWADPQRKPDGTERAQLMGKAVVFKTREISGPRPFACAKPQYKVVDYGPDMIFQGALDEMRRADKKVDPKALATSLGFSNPPIRTLETGCEIDVHFVDDTTAEVGLNNYVYTLKKRQLALANAHSHGNKAKRRTN
ncbi:hypothetical protein RAD15_11950 [Bradyrhizobium sp. 14AA]